jgi:hypothetical protein
MKRIPYPIPIPDRAELIAAGKNAMRYPLKTPERAVAGFEVREVIAAIALKYGIEEAGE